MIEILALLRGLLCCIDDKQQSLSGSKLKILSIAVSPASLIKDSYHAIDKSFYTSNRMFS